MNSIDLISEFEENIIYCWNALLIIIDRIIGSSHFSMLYNIVSY